MAPGCGRLALAWQAVVPVIAHPLLEARGLPVSPAVVATAAALVMVLLWRGLAARRSAAPSDRAPRGRGAVAGPWLPAGRPDDAPLVPRAIGVALLALAIAAARLGSPRELENIASVLVVGAGWPLLVLASLVVGDVWRRLDPFDTLARLVQPLGAAAGPPAAVDDVRAAAPAAVFWIGWLALYPFPLAPRPLGAVMAGYTLAIVAASLLGGRRVVPRIEAVGVVLGLLAAWRRPDRGRPPRGTALLVGIVGGGALFGALVVSTLGGDLSFLPFAGAWRAAAFAACVLAAVALVTALDAAAARRGTPGLASTAAVPALGGLLVAVALSYYRLTTSVQLLVRHASDPFGTGLDLLGTADLAVTAQPLPLGGLVAVQVAVLGLGAAAALVVAVRRSPDRARQAPAVAAACTLCTAGALVVSAL